MWNLIAAILATLLASALLWMAMKLINESIQKPEAPGLAESEKEGKQ